MLDTFLRDIIKKGRKISVTGSGKHTATMDIIFDRVYPEIMTQTNRGGMEGKLERRLPIDDIELENKLGGIKLKTKVSDLTVDELKLLINESIQESFNEVMEDIIAALSPEYLNSIEAARKDFREGRIKTFEEVFDV